MEITKITTEKLLKLILADKFQHFAEHVNFYGMIDTYYLYMEGDNIVYEQEDGEVSLHIKENFAKSFKDKIWRMETRYLN